ncbi:type VI secretion system transmembrane protein TssO [Capnocytophaga felis]|uniref:Type VI secretion system transmembrane protein TssO n=1 Tax=Capnocytophaga felis TaxID=2267611 RepID=A0A5M4BBV0_9FLAO|nr:type VI secretion system transmembrane protein TssO [Capnocytophaga felis]GET47058.1 hypothetical protein RCZ01_23600 [Capnocytophaga felis]GET48994.1 hypothetical protein RCZ02_18250 [Capnocytophaga felis]
METKNETNKITNSRERTIGFVYVCIIFCVTTVLCGYILFFANNHYQSLEGKKAILEQIQRVRQFEKEQVAQMDKIQQIDKKIAQLNPALKAAYEKQEVALLLGEIRNVYTQQKWDVRYKIFDHIATFYEFQMSDKDRLWNIQQNIEKFKLDLERCRANTEIRRNNLNQQ